jgi:HSP20 family molecular chaperone IbpA
MNEIKLNLAGYKKNEVNLSVEKYGGGHYLALAADSPSYGRQYWEHEVESTTDTDKISAKLEYGILTISLPEGEPPKTHTVPIL